MKYFLRFRLVRCPHWACDEQISVTDLTSHVLSSECGDNYMSDPLPYQVRLGHSHWSRSINTVL